MNVRNIIIPAIAGALGLGLGFTAGNAGDTETASPPAVTVEQPAVPDICIVALSRAETAMDYSGQGLALMGDAFEALSMGDSVGAGYVADELDRLFPLADNSVTQYKNAAAECRALVPAVAG